jgi:hypothetical protein
LCYLLFQVSQDLARLGSLDKYRVHEVNTKGRIIRNYTVVPKYCRTTIFESGRLFFRIIRTP